MSGVAIEKKKAEVLGRRMAYVERGTGDPVVFLHGNPTSSYLWREVTPHVEKLGRCIAPDLIGMGDSDKLPDAGPQSYTFLEHSRYLEAFLEKVDASRNVTLVIHDWGSALGFDWARRHRNSVKGICYMEAIVRPITWAEFPGPLRETFRKFRSPEGEAMILEQNQFIEQVLPASVMRALDEAEMAEYRRPFLGGGEDRRPMLTWPRQIPIEGEPAEVVNIVQAYSDWLSTDETLPKLFINAEPGALIRGVVRDFCRAWPNQTEVTVKGTHFIQEDSGDEIGQALAAWLAGLDDSAARSS